MFKVFKLDDEGCEDSIAYTHSEQIANELCDKYSDDYPHAVIDYYYTTDYS